MRKLFKYLILVILLVAIIAGYFVYQQIFSNNINTASNNLDIEIPTGSNLDDLTKILSQQDILINQSSFETVARLMKYDQKVRSGKYTLRSKMNNKEIISFLRSGRQTPIQLVINNVRDYKQLAGKLANPLESDSSQFVKHFEKIITTQNIDPQALLYHFIPNTYEVYWNTSPDDLLVRMKKETNKFWDQNNRRNKASQMGLSLNEVYTLASIVEKETNLNSEKKLVAGVYYNRLKKEIPLQADPTVVFANNDFTIKRVLNRHLEKDSPYNTYKNSGLPPGPIYMPSISSLDAALSPDTDQNYLYFCAKPGYDGGHLFAKNLIQHNRNARIYHRWLNAEGIR